MRRGVDPAENVLREYSKNKERRGGKRLRAALVLFCSSINSGNDPKIQESAVDIAAAVELIHSATLVHDDIVDNAVLRRLKPSVNIKYGVEVSVLLGDFLYARAFEIIAKVADQDITSWMSETTQKMCEGELDQLRNRYRADLSTAEYISFIGRKTASLISACARSGARLGGMTAKEQNSLADFGENIGISFQIIDDLLDVVGSENRLGKTLRTDAGNGKILEVEQADGVLWAESFQSASRFCRFSSKFWT